MPDSLTDTIIAFEEELRQEKIHSLLEDSGRHGFVFILSPSEKSPEEVASNMQTMPAYAFAKYLESCKQQLIEFIAFKIDIFNRKNFFHRLFNRSKHLKIIDICKRHERVRNYIIFYNFFSGTRDSSS